VVAKLFGATEPDAALFGRKDYQQLAIIRRMVADLDHGVEIVGIPIVREPDGLALSSRNVRLTTDDRAAATVLVHALTAGRERFVAGQRDAGTIRELVVARIEAEPRARLEYVELVDASTLEPLDRLDRPAVALTAAWFGDVRLIDNIALADG
jgi:pantoate--beta-alanine ligase